jgi:hypothetical protein
VESYQIRRRNDRFSIRLKAGWTFIDVKFRVKKTFGIVPGQYKLNELLIKLQTEIRSIGTGFEDAKVEYNKDLDRVTISETTRKLLISSYSKNSIFPMLGFANDVKTNRDNWYQKNPNATNKEIELVESPAYTLVDYILIDGPTVFEASLPPKLTRIDQIYVYTDIIQNVLIGNTQAPCLGYLPVQTKWGNQGYWSFNNLFYIRVNQNFIRTISIRLCDSIGNTIEFEYGTVVCRLHFRRSGLMQRIL